MQMNNAYTYSPTIFAEAVLGLNVYPWQAETMEAVAAGMPTALVAANGSGKTAGCIAPLALWFMTRYPKGTLVVTSGSFRQVSHQLWANMKMHAARLPFLEFQPKGVEIALAGGGRALGFSASDAGKAEGWHGSFDNETPLMVIVDEAKTVNDAIFTAFDRCTKQFVLYASSPGSAAGQHFRCFHGERELWHKVTATAFDCPHIPRDKIERVRVQHGEDSWLYRSMMLAQWTEGEGNLILRPSELRECLDNPPELLLDSGRMSSFHDFAAGGDEDAIASRVGNVITLEAHWRDADTVRSRRKHVKWCRDHCVRPHEAWGDASGAGKNIVQQMADDGFAMRSFLGGKRSENDDYYNYNADVWFGFARAVRLKQLVLRGVTVEAFDQLTTREQSLHGKDGLLMCETKEKMKSRGLTSPDLGDVIAGAWWSQRWLVPRAAVSLRSAPLRLRETGFYSGHESCGL